MFEQLFKRGLKRGFFRLTTVSLIFTAVACGENSNQSDSVVTGSLGMGTLRIDVTDAPACGMSSVSIAIAGIRLHSDATASPDDPLWRDVRINPPVTLELLDLQNGNVAPLAQLQLPAGDYRQISLELATSEKGVEPAHHVQLLSDPPGTRRPLTVPDSAIDGITVGTSVKVLSDQVRSLVLDIDACQSIVPAAANQTYLLDPQVVPIAVDAIGKREISGELDPSYAGATVMAQVMQADGLPRLLKSTVVAADGLYVLSPLAQTPGQDVNVVIVAPGKPVHVITDVPARAGEMLSMPNVYLLDSEQDPFVTGLALGEVTTPNDAGASVSVVQMFGTYAVELARTPVDAQDHTYTLELPGEAPRVARWQADSLTFDHVSVAPGAPGAPALILRAQRRDDPDISDRRVINPSETGKATRWNFDLTDQSDLAG